MSLSVVYLVSGKDNDDRGAYCWSGVISKELSNGRFTPPVIYESRAYSGCATQFINKMSGYFYPNKFGDFVSKIKGITGGSTTGPVMLGSSIEGPPKRGSKPKAFTVHSFGIFPFGKVIRVQVRVGEKKRHVCFLTGISPENGGQGFMFSTTGFPQTKGYLGEIFADIENDFYANISIHSHIDTLLANETEKKIILTNSVAFFEETAKKHPAEDGGVYDGPHVIGFPTPNNEDYKETVGSVVDSFIDSQVKDRGYKAIQDNSTTFFSKVVRLRDIIGTNIENSMLKKSKKSKSRYVSWDKDEGLIV